jgi:hypothetical protein
VEQVKRPRPRPSPLARRILRYVARHCGPTAAGWKRKLAALLAREFGGPLGPGEAITRDAWNVVKRDIADLRAVVFRRARAHEAPCRLPSLPSREQPVPRPKEKK